MLSGRSVGTNSSWSPRQRQIQPSPRASQRTSARRPSHAMACSDRTYAAASPADSIGHEYRSRRSNATIPPTRPIRSSTATATYSRQRTRRQSVADESSVQRTPIRLRMSTPRRITAMASSCTKASCSYAAPKSRSTPPACPGASVPRPSQHLDRSSTPGPSRCPPAA